MAKYYFNYFFFSLKNTKLFIWIKDQRLSRKYSGFLFLVSRISGATWYSNLWQNIINLFHISTKLACVFKHDMTKDPQKCRTKKDLLRIFINANDSKWNFFIVLSTRNVSQRTLKTRKFCRSKLHSYYVVHQNYQDWYFVPEVWRIMTDIFTVILVILLKIRRIMSEIVLA